MFRCHWIHEVYIRETWKEDERRPEILARTKVPLSSSLPRFTLFPSLSLAFLRSLSLSLFRSSPRSGTLCLDLIFSLGRRQPSLFYIYIKPTRTGASSDEVVKSFYVRVYLRISIAR